jgi:nicotinate dehydrogenase subunit A
MAGFTLNGAAVAPAIEDDATLLAALRGPLGLSGPRFGCGAEQCGACVVLVDGVPAYACTLPVAAVALIGLRHAHTRYLESDLYRTEEGE